MDAPLNGPEPWYLEPFGLDTRCVLPLDFEEYRIMDFFCGSGFAVEEGRFNLFVDDAFHNQI